MKRSTILLAFAAVTLSACGASQSAAPPAPATPAEQLEALLATAITPEQDARYDAFEAEHGARALNQLLPALAVDRTADPLARANAVLRMGAANIYDFDVFLVTVADEDPRVRGATIGTVGRTVALTPDRAMPILARGLVDSEPGIQAKTLQELRDRNLDLLHDYLERGPAPELRDIALQIIRSSHAWGTPVEPEADGSLRRVAPSGHELWLRPDRRWPEYDLVMGTLTVTPENGAARVIADSVEAVAGVIPAVIDATGRYVAVETDRRIEVHDLESGAVRQLGPGIAPRPLPFSTDLLYWREQSRTDGPRETVIRYEFMRAPFEGGPAQPFDTAEIRVDPRRRGFLSPLRWARIVDNGTAFSVWTDGMEGHPLPTPLQGRAE